MKKTHLLFIAVIIIATLFSEQVSAKIWRVNNNATGTYGQNLGGSSAYPIFKQLNDANASPMVNAGDTLYVEGSGTIYSSATITKQLIIIGPGYFLGENPETSSDGMTANISQITFSNTSPGSVGSQLIGVEVSNSNGVIINKNVNDILIKRCKIDFKIDLQYASNNSDISVIDNFFSNAGGNDANSVINVNTLGFPANFIFNNNISKGQLNLSWDNDIIYTASECNNNVFDCLSFLDKLAIKINANSFRNNILTNPNDTVSINNGSYDNVDYNISASQTKQFGTSNHNIIVYDFSTLFVNSNSSDRRYQIKPGSVGSKSGSDGTDRGAFGNTPYYAYTLSGLAPIPVIYQITTPGAAANNLPVTISARIIK